MIIGTLTCFVFGHFIIGLAGNDIGTFEVLNFFFGLDRALSIWWHPLFDFGYCIAHMAVIYGGLIYGFTHGWGK